MMGLIHVAEFASLAPPSHGAAVLTCRARSFIPTFCDDIIPHKYAEGPSFFVVD